MGMMYNHLRTLFAALSILALSACAGTSRPVAEVAAEARAPVTILISIDGLRPDYLDRGVSPNINALAASGVKASMRPSFPSLTFPNHHSLVTGLRPDRHGIVDNTMIDARRPDVRFTLGDPRQSLDPFWWDEAEPIWVTAEKAGIRTGTMFWPGSEVAIHGARPQDWLRYDKAVSGTQRINTVLDWMRRPAAIRPRFVTLYFDTVDTVGHELGPDAPETTAAFAEVDRLIGELISGLKVIGQSANILLVSDHGMGATADDRVIRIDRMIAPDVGMIVTEGPLSGVNALPGKDAEVAATLLAPHEHMQCWRKSALPAHFAYGKNPRVPEFLCLAARGWAIQARDREHILKGMHGYDPAEPDMAAVFIAAGPAIASGAALPVFDNVDVYPLLARLVGIAPVSNVDGRAETLNPLLRAAN
ncbi:alkaline phosphatase family protein [Sphingosinicella microcystinivorans]|uniref:AlkP superfamily pyrophosphatase or phosphodiesterase n=2 Tax=Sphingosinicella microcystinivorans TaxID=335406 RepID=A0AAD1D3M4_SPHMI|nr:putative AlkP superfamily pyrophosphatase or phosphodiesterase [Sphingosinicella microcystinivorans]BBE32792.1 alkaline phosphatase family protein [Sphingosinicella microcystinivorans]